MMIKTTFNTRCVTHRWLDRIIHPRPRSHSQPKKLGSKIFPPLYPIVLTPIAYILAIVLPSHAQETISQPHSPSEPQSINTSLSPDPLSHPPTLPLSHSPTPSESDLEHLLRLRRAQPAKAAEIDTLIQRSFIESHAVLVLDMSGFSRVSQNYGIIHALTMIQTLRDTVAPVIAENEGAVLKWEADNVFAVFPNAASALSAAATMTQQLAAADIQVSIGIGYGELIMLQGGAGQREAYGEQLNLASKLGEDLAEVGEIMMTEAAFAQFSAQAQPEELNAWQAIETTISGLQLNVFRSEVVQ